MSIILENENLTFVSHFKYIKSIYSDVEKKQIQLNPLLFDINSKYIQNLSSKKGKKRKLELSNDSKYIKNQFEQIMNDKEKFKSTINSDIFDDDNHEAQQFSEFCYKATIENLFLNSHGGNHNDYAIIQNYLGKDYLFPAKCNFYCKDINLMKDEVFETKFDFILMDPPWWNKYIRRKKKKISSHSYEMMYDHNLKNIPIDKILNKNGLVAIWITNSPSHLNFVEKDLLPFWNLKKNSRWFWLKITKNFEPICDFSEPNGKQPYEQIIFATHSDNTNLTIKDNKILFSIPSAIHSHKPPLVEVIKPYLKNDPKCLEIFARYLLPNWTSWGLEVCKFQDLCLYQINGKI